MTNTARHLDLSQTAIFHKDDDWVWFGDSLTMSLADLPFDGSVTFGDTNGLPDRKNREFDGGAFFEILRRHADLPYLVCFRPKSLKGRHPERAKTLKTLGYRRPCGHLPAYWEYCSEPAEVANLILNTVALVLHPNGEWTNALTVTVVEGSDGVPYHYI